MTKRKKKMSKRTRKFLEGVWKEKAVLERVPTAQEANGDVLEYAELLHLQRVRVRVHRPRIPPADIRQEILDALNRGELVAPC